MFGSSLFDIRKTFVTDPLPVFLTFLVSYFRVIFLSHFQCFIFQVLVAIFPKQQDDKSTATQTRYFDFERKTWEPLPSMASLTLGSQELLPSVSEDFLPFRKTFKFLCAEYVGNYLYVAVENQFFNSSVIYRYHVVNNTWETLPRFQSARMGRDHVINCLCSVNEYIYAISDTDPPQRYSLAQNQWQSGSKLPLFKKSNNRHKLCNIAAVVMKSKIYVLHGCCIEERQGLTAQTAVFHCFDPEKNEWKQKASTSSPHFGSTLFVDNNKLYVAGGKISCCQSDDLSDILADKVIPNEYGDPAQVEVYDEKNNQWFVIKQSHVPPNNLEAVEVEGKVYFIINKLPVDSGIRIPPGEVYHISLDEWETKGIAEIGNNAALCYLPVKKESLENKVTNEKKASLKGKAKKGTKET